MLFLLNTGHICLVVCMSSNFELRPGLCEWHMAETLGSVMCIWRVSTCLSVCLFWQEVNLAGQELKHPLSSLRLSWAAWVCPGCIVLGLTRGLAELLGIFGSPLCDSLPSGTSLMLLIPWTLCSDSLTVRFQFLASQGTDRGLPSGENHKNGKSLSLLQISTPYQFLPICGHSQWLLSIVF